LVVGSPGKESQADAIALQKPLGQTTGDADGHTIRVGHNEELNAQLRSGQRYGVGDKHALTGGH